METRPTLLLLKGLPCSGKTEFAQRWVAEDATQRVRVSWRDLLWTLTTRPTRATRLLAMEGAVHLMVEAMKQGMSVVSMKKISMVWNGACLSHTHKNTRHGCGGRPCPSTWRKASGATG